jgi:hypothetical protein
MPPENLKRHGSFLKELLNDLYALGAAVHQINHSNVQPFWVSAQIRLQEAVSGLQIELGYALLVRIEGINKHNVNITIFLGIPQQGGLSQC